MERHTSGPTLMNGISQRLIFSWLSWRHGRVIAFPGEAIPPEADLIAYAESQGMPLRDAAEAVSKGRAPGLLLALLQGEFRNLLESFVNHHDLGLDGRPPQAGAGYPRAQVPLGNIRIFSEALGGPELEDVLRQVDACQGETLPYAAVAGLIAAFYSVLPALAARQETTAHTIALPEILDPAQYVRPDPAYRMPVAGMTSLVRGRLAWAFRLFLLHGSLATEDYLPGISDFDTFAILRDGVARSSEALLRLRNELLEVFPHLYGIDPQQHHGVMLIAGEDTLYFPQAFFPLTLIAHGRTIYPESPGTLEFRERPDRYERMHALYSVRQNFRWLAMGEHAPASQFEAKFHVQLVLLAPAFFVERDGVYIYKRESFPATAAVFEEEQLACLRKAEKVRTGNLYSIPLAWNEHQATAQDLEWRIGTFRSAVRQVKPSSALLEFLGPGFWEDSALLLELFCSVPPGGHGAAINPVQAILRDVAQSIAWKNPPRPVPETAYEQAAAGLRQHLNAIAPGLEVWQFGSVSEPGISDLDTLLVAPSGTGLPDELSTFWAEFMRKTEDTAYVFQHPPSMLLPKDLLPEASKLYPIFQAGRPEAPAEEVSFSDKEHARYHLCALIEMACCYFFRQTLAALLRKQIDVRQILLSMSGYKHSLRVLRANGLEAPGVEQFAARVTQLRKSWFGSGEQTRQQELLSTVVDAVGAEFAIVEGLRSGIGLLVDGADVLAEFKPGTIVASLFDEVLFVTGWTPESALSNMLNTERLGGRMRLVYPAEFAVLLAEYARHEGIWATFLRTHLAHRFTRHAPAHTAPEVEERRRLVEAHYQFLRSQGLHTYGLPQWALDPTAPATPIGSWNGEGLRHILEMSSTIEDYLSSVRQTETLLSEARRLVDTGAFAEARKSLEALDQSIPGEPRVLYLLGFVTLSQKGNPEQAVTLLSRALAAGCDPFWGHYVRAQAYSRMHRFAEAEDDLRAAAALRPSDDAGIQNAARLLDQAKAAQIDDLSRLAQQSLEAGNHEDALEKAAAIVALDFANPFGHYCTAYALQVLGRDAGIALQAYERALETGFDPFWVYYHRAQLSLSLGNPQAARNDLEAAARLKPDHAGIAAVRRQIDSYGTRRRW
jgi:tetratricopeptide (TPR) repeat protein